MYPDLKQILIIKYCNIIIIFCYYCCSLFIAFIAILFSYYHSVSETFYSLLQKFAHLLFESLNFFHKDRDDGIIIH